MTLYSRAKQIVLTNRSFSISLLEREMRIGYGECARLVEKMQKRGVTV